VHAIPLALATLSTVAAAINSGFDPFSVIIGPPDRHYTPVIPTSVFGSRLVGNKNNISALYRQHYNDITQPANVAYEMASSRADRLVFGLFGVLNCPLYACRTRTGNARQNTFIYGLTPARIPTGNVALHEQRLAGTFATSTG